VVPKDRESEFLMNHIVGIRVADGHKLRVPLFKNADGSLGCAAEVPEGSLIHIMEADDADIIQAGTVAVGRAPQQADDGTKSAGTIACECVATRLKLADAFANEVAATAASLRPTPLVGCASFGQLARIRGEFSGLMDATSLVCLIPA